MVEDIPENSGLHNSNVKTGFDSAGKPTVTYTRDIESGTALSVARLNPGGNDWTLSTLNPWTGNTNYDEPTKLTELLLNSGTTASGSKLNIGHYCKGQIRELAIDDGDAAGSFDLVSNALKATDRLPASLTKTEFPGSSYNIIYRTATTKWARGTAMMKWEAGAMIANNAEPQPGSYPAEGSTL
ncbi:hypothetical protein D9V32_02340 [Mycetocola tolaasinivorans]|uniref:Uncharacterized protein n=1 Tax=Mycetocola tolaasinivorans TaxID=76635 RepID=A0A3L7ABX7_9MICO|nr:hypothetical protein [Mycetocola tolaasinivorans]RLP77310.1 hypothetical protein D9V32_02340 [Mycetocola tolaasinivorans]